MVTSSGYQKSNIYLCVYLIHFCVIMYFREVLMFFDTRSIDNSNTGIVVTIHHYTTFVAEDRKHPSPSPLVARVVQDIVLELGKVYLS